MDFAEYKQIDRMNASTLVHGLHSMRRLKRYMDKGVEDEDTLCKALGVATHALLLEPEEFERLYVVMPDYHLMPENLRKAKSKKETDEERRSTSKGTEFYEARVKEFMAENQGKRVIAREAYDKCLYAIEQIRSHHEAPNLLEDARFEQTLFGEIAGIPFKCRVDILKRRLVADLKTTFNAEQRAFGRVAADKNYAFRLSIYRDIARQNFSGQHEVKILVQEIGNDSDTCVVNVPEIVLDNAFDDVHRVIDGMKASARIGKWFGVDKGMKQVELYVPNWAMRDELVEVGDEV